MHLTVERGSSNQGIQVIRTVVDTIQECNLRCIYCHPGQTWVRTQLPADKIKDVMIAAEQAAFFEVTLTGGEITMHPQFKEIMKATHVLNRTVASVVTNATRVTSDVVRQFRDSNIGRICVSLDGATPELHNQARGKSFSQAFNGLKQLQTAEKDITVISVAHYGNFRGLLNLSRKLAQEGLANQHHICAPSYSGEAKKHYEKIRLQEENYHQLQDQIDEQFDDLKRQGLFVTFNSYWPATGQRSRVDTGREMTLVQLTEQSKDVYIIVRSNGAVRLTSAAWGRETVGNAVVGNLHQATAPILFAKVDEIYRRAQVRQLPREVEARHKFHIGPDANKASTDDLLADQETAQTKVIMVPIRPVRESDVLRRPLQQSDLDSLKNAVSALPSRYRLIQHASGAYILFDRKTTQVTLLKESEANRLIV